jgi:hypothetical protein
LIAKVEDNILCGERTWRAGESCPNHLISYHLKLKTDYFVDVTVFVNIDKIGRASANLICWTSLFALD